MGNAELLYRKNGDDFQIVLTDDMTLNAEKEWTNFGDHKFFYHERMRDATRYVVRSCELKANAAIHNVR